MKRFTKSLLAVSLFFALAVPAWGQSTPSTEGRDFWVTFLQAQQNPTELILTISAKNACSVTVENTNANYSTTFTVDANSSTVLSTATAPQTATPRRPLQIANCYSTSNEQATYTALHVTATEDISLFAGNYISKTFDAANVLPTPALLDDYIIQVYPPSDHGGDNESRGSHFAIVAVEDNTTVDYNLTAKTAKGNTGAQTVTLNKGQVYYVWTGKGVGDPADLSGTTVKARNGKKIAVFQGCPHTNVPLKIRDRDHLFSQAMPTAYWGSEFGITSSLQHRRDIVAVMAINDGTEVYINNEDGDPILVHTFDFTKDKKHYWTFEIGEAIAYCNDSDNPKQPLEEPLVIDSSCYITTSCPVGVHLFMVSNKYDNIDANGKNNCDPAMLWISPIEQVIKEINFSTYNKGTNVHYMNIVTTTSDISNILWTDTAGITHNLQSEFHPLYGNPDYSYARIKIGAGSHHLQGNVGFLAHVYGYGVNESYAYSCGSSTIQRSVTFNGSPLTQDSLYPGKFCVDEPIEMKLNIGNNEYESIEWLFGDGTSYVPGVDVPNEQKTRTTHTYTTPGWYDLIISAVYVNTCTGEQSTGEAMRFSFLVVRPDTVIGEVIADTCVSLESYKENPEYWDKLIANGKIDTVQEHCYDDVVLNMITYRRETEEYKDTLRGWNEVYSPYNGYTYYESTDVVDESLNTYGCTHYTRYYVEVTQCLDMSFSADGLPLCPGENVITPYIKNKGDIKDDQGRFVVPGLIDTVIPIPNYNTQIGELTLPTRDLKTPGYYTGTLTIEDKNCDTKQYQIHLVVNYPSDIFQFKFNNVLAVYQNQGYQFSAYQWYINGLPVDGATSSVLYLGENVTFQTGDVVYVMLTDKNGMTLPSCPQQLNDIPDYTPDENKAPARKMIINSQFIIRKDNSDYDIYGQRVR